MAARQGDSGGPIFNARGEVAGVLFGSNDSFFTGQYTLGSYCGRVRRFVAAAGGDFQRLPVNPAMVARQGPAVAGPAPVAAIAAQQPPPTHRPPAAGDAAAGLSPDRAAGPASGRRRGETVGRGHPAAGPRPGEQIKTILAAIGVFALLFHGIRLIGCGRRVRQFRTSCPRPHARRLHPAGLASPFRRLPAFRHPPPSRTSPLSGVSGGV